MTLQECMEVLKRAVAEYEQRIEQDIRDCAELFADLEQHEAKQKKLQEDRETLKRFFAFFAEENAYLQDSDRLTELKRGIGEETRFVEEIEQKLSVRRSYYNALRFKDVSKLWNNQEEACMLAGVYYLFASSEKSMMKLVDYLLGQRDEIPERVAKYLLAKALTGTRTEDEKLDDVLESLAERTVTDRQEEAWAACLQVLRSRRTKSLCAECEAVIHLYEGSIRAFEDYQKEERKTRDTMRQQLETLKGDAQDAATTERLKQAQNWFRTAGGEMDALIREEEGRSRTAGDKIEELRKLKERLEREVQEGLSGAEREQVRETLQQYRKEQANTVSTTPLERKQKEMLAGLQEHVKDVKALRKADLENKARALEQEQEKIRKKAERNRDRREWWRNHRGLVWLLRGLLVLAVTPLFLLLYSYFGADAWKVRRGEPVRLYTYVTFGDAMGNFFNCFDSGLSAMLSYFPSAGNRWVVNGWVDKEGTMTIPGSGEVLDLSISSQSDEVPEVSRVVIPEGVREISLTLGGTSFSQVSEVVLPDGLERINRLSMPAGITTLYAPNVKSIGDQALAGNALQKVDLPKAEEIGKEAFAHCADLKDVSLPNAVNIGEGAFNDCQTMEKINLPCVVLLEGGIFASCYELREVEVPQAEEIGRAAFASCGSLKQLALPNAITIGFYAFEHCDNLEEIDLPCATDIGENAFEYCKALQEVCLPSAVNIGHRAFLECDSMQRVVLPAAETVGAELFGWYIERISEERPNETLEQIFLGGNLREVHSAAFNHVYSEHVEIVLDSGAEYAPEALEQLQAAIAEHPNFVIVYADYEEIGIPRVQ